MWITGSIDSVANVSLVERQMTDYFSSSMWSTPCYHPYLRVALPQEFRAKYTKGYSSQWLVTQTSDSLIIIITRVSGLDHTKTIKQHYIYVLLHTTYPALFPLFGGCIFLLLWRHRRWWGLLPSLILCCSFPRKHPFLWDHYCLTSLSLPVCPQARTLCLFLKLYNIRIKFIPARWGPVAATSPPGPSNYDWVNAGGIDPYLWNNQKIIIKAVTSLVIPQLLLCLPLATCPVLCLIFTSIFCHFHTWPKGAFVSCFSSH